MIDYQCQVCGVTEQRHGGTPATKRVCTTTPGCRGELKRLATKVMRPLLVRCSVCQDQQATAFDDSSIPFVVSVPPCKRCLEKAEADAVDLYIQTIQDNVADRVIKERADG